MVLFLKNIDQIYMKSTDLVFDLKNMDWIYMKSTNLFFVLKNIGWIYMQRHRSGFCFEKHRLDFYEKTQIWFF